MWIKKITSKISTVHFIILGNRRVCNNLWLNRQEVTRDLLHLPVPHHEFP